MQDLYLELNSGDFPPVVLQIRSLKGGKDYWNICSGLQYYVGLKLMNCETLMKMKSATNHCC